MVMSNGTASKSWEDDRRNNGCVHYEEEVAHMLGTYRYLCGPSLYWQGHGIVQRNAKLKGELSHAPVEWQPEIPGCDWQDRQH